MGLSARELLRLIGRYRNQLVVILTPLVLLPLPLLVSGKEALCGYALLLLATYWCTEAIPIAATALIPVFLFPMLGILTVHVTVRAYMKDTIMMFFGGLAVAIALEKNNLHKRIALSILRLIGTQPKWLLLGFMFPTWFLSMWISNTATTAMMIPMVEAVLEQLRPKHEAEEGEEAMPTYRGYETEVELFPMERNGTVVSDEEEKRSLVDKTEIDAVPNPTTPDSPPAGQMDPLVTFQNQLSIPKCPVNLVQEQARFDNMTKGFLLSVAYAANVGGVATLTGTPPNLILKGFVDEIWQDRGLKSPVDFPSWMIYGFPIAAICLVIVWYWMQLYYLGIKTTCVCWKKQKGDEGAKKLIEDEYQKLGPMRYAEYMVAIMFILLVALWFFRNPDFMSGWAAGYPQGFIGDSVPAIMVTLVMFVIPATMPRIYDEDGELDIQVPETLLDWETMHKKQPWGTHLLIGGGFALAAAVTESGLAAWIGLQLEVFEALPGWAMVTVLSFLVTFLTNVTSNTAMCTLLMPIMAIMAEGLHWNPLYLMFPVCVATSLAFMLPVGTPPNAIVFSSGKLRVIDMVKVGLFLNIFCVFSITLATETWGRAYFDFGTLPWDVNATMPGEDAKIGT